MDILDNISSSELNNYKLLDLVENIAPTNGRYRFITDLRDSYSGELFQFILDDITNHNETPKIESILDLSIRDIVEMFDMDKELLISILEYILLFHIPFDCRVKDLKDILDNLRDRIDLTDIYNKVILELITGESVKYVIDEESTYIWVEEFIRLFLTKIMTYVDNDNFRFIYCGLSTRDTVGLVLFNLENL